MRAKKPANKQRVKFFFAEILALRGINTLYQRVTQNNFERDLNQLNSHALKKLSQLKENVPPLSPLNGIEALLHPKKRKYQGTTAMEDKLRLLRFRPDRVHQPTLRGPWQG